MTQVHFIDAENPLEAFNCRDAFNALKKNLPEYLRTADPTEIVQIFYVKEGKQYSFPVLVSSLLDEQDHFSDEAQQANERATKRV